MATSTSINFGDREAKTVTISAAKTVTTSESGTTFVLDAAAGAAITLPALAHGLYYRFIVGATFDTTDWVISSAEGDNINGLLIVNGASVPAVGEDNVIFELGAESIGDSVEFFADKGNSQWIVTGSGSLASSMTTTDPA
jgi:hypothetical protein